MKAGVDKTVSRFHSVAPPKWISLCFVAVFLVPEVGGEAEVDTGP